MSAAKTKDPRSVTIASRGIQGSEDITELMCALIADVIHGSVTPQAANATCRAADKMIEQLWPSR